MYQGFDANNSTTATMTESAVHIKRQQPDDEEGPDEAIERNHELLSFQSLATAPVRTTDNAQASVSVSAQLQGTFFVAADPPEFGPDSAMLGQDAAAAGIKELTCYRRNLFQVTGFVLIPRNVQLMVANRDGEWLPAQSFEAVLAAIESTEGKSVQVISVPWKTPLQGTAGAPPPPTGPQPKQEPEPIKLSFGRATSTAADPALFSINWKRLQFRSATANNGRRKELQQQFRLRIAVVATLADGTRETVAESESGPIVVRGRSPRNFSSKNDIPLSSADGMSKRGVLGTLASMQSGMDASAYAHEHDYGHNKALANATEIPTSHPVLELDSRSAPRPTVSPHPPSAMSNDGSSATQGSAHPYDPNAPPGSAGADPAFAFSPSLWNWMDVPAGMTPPYPTGMTPPNMPLQHAPSPLSSMTSNLRHSHDPQSFDSLFGSPTAGAAERTQQPLAPPPPPSSLSRNHSYPIFNAPVDQHRAASANKETSSSASPPSTRSNPDDQLYEYLPLGVDEWMPPVDAVYRPHVVHHINKTSNLSRKRPGRSKRLFSEEEL